MSRPVFLPGQPVAVRADALDDDLGHPRVRLRRRTARTSSAQSSGRIIRSGGIPDHDAIGVSTNAGASAVQRTPSASSSAFSDRVSASTAAFVAP